MDKACQTVGIICFSAQFSVDPYDLSFCVISPAWSWSFSPGPGALNPIPVSASSAVARPSTVHLFLAVGSGNRSLGVHTELVSVPEQVSELHIQILGEGTLLDFLDTQIRVLSHWSRQPLRNILFRVLKPLTGISCLGFWNR